MKYRVGLGYFQCDGVAIVQSEKGDIEEILNEAARMGIGSVYTWEDVNEIWEADKKMGDRDALMADSDFDYACGYLDLHYADPIDAFIDITELHIEPVPPNSRLGIVKNWVDTPKNRYRRLNV